MLSKFPEKKTESILLRSEKRRKAHRLVCIEQVRQRTPSTIIEWEMIENYYNIIAKIMDIHKFELKKSAVDGIYFIIIFITKKIVCEMLIFNIFFLCHWKILIYFVQHISDNNLSVAGNFFRFIVFSFCYLFQFGSRIWHNFILFVFYNKKPFYCLAFCKPCD